MSCLGSNVSSVCWERPPAGWLKCNVDAGTFDSRGMVSFGGVLRSSDGTFVAEKCARFAGRFGTRDAEALGVREALRWIKDLHLSRIVLEMACLEVYNALVDNFYH